MYLKKYQIKVVNALRQFLQTACDTKTYFDIAKQVLPENMRHTLNWVQTTFQTGSLEYKDRCTNGLGNNYPRMIIKVPTGGGKTLLAVESIREYQNLFAQKRTGLVVWIVPSETIYSQTVQKIRDKSNHLRQLLDQCSGNRTIILEKGQRLTTNDIEENLVVLFVMIQSISRANGKEALKVFQDSGGYDSFFPADNRYDLHEQLLNQVPNLDYISPLGTEQPLIMTSLGNAIRISKPFIIIDEIHKVFSENARKTINSLNPEFVLGFSATPKAEMNVLVTITGLELKEEEMVKLDMHILPPISKQENDWKAMVKEIKEHREKLEDTAKQYQKDTGVYIRPTALLQVEATGKDQRGKYDRVHSLDVKEYLVSLEVNPDEIAIKTSSQNDIEDVNLFSHNCPVRFIITKEALREGWDFSFAYILGIIPNVNSNTGVTQLVGRILRQPFARKSGVKELDESYVYYTKGDTREILDRVSTGFKNEGLEDLVTKLKFRDNETINATKTVKIKKEFSEKFQNSFYLPVWLMVDKSGSKRRFNYESDIKPKVDFTKLELNDEFLTKLKNSLSNETKERKAFAITLDDSGKASFVEEQSQTNGKAEINIDYLTRRLNELIENPFLARIIGMKYLKRIEEKIGDEKLKEHFSFIVSQLCKKFQEEKTKQEEDIFLAELKARHIVLAVSDDTVGFKVPKEDVITASPIPSTYKYYLFEDVEVTAMNTLERKVGDLLDKQEKILWWFRNKVSRNWYSIQGWQQNKIRPDFVAAKKGGDNHLELVYIIESKGEHLLGNVDTAYKKKVLDVMTEQKQLKSIKAYQTQIPFDECVINDKIECYLIEDGQEEQRIKELLK